jgi:hypothetical protein
MVLVLEEMSQDHNESKDEKEDKAKFVNHIDKEAPLISLDFNSGVPTPFFQRGFSVAFTRI